MNVIISNPCTWGGIIVENRRMSYAVAMNIDNTDTCFTRKSPGYLQVLFLPLKNIWFENAVPWYKLSLLCHLNILDRLQSIRKCHEHKMSIQLTFDEKCRFISEFRDRTFKAYQLTSGVQFNQWKVLLVAQGSTTRTCTVAVVPEIITLILLADI